MSDPAEQNHTGGCLCGAARYRIRGPLAAVSVCHCVFCRRTLTRGGSYTSCATNDLDVTTPRSLKWYRSSPTAKRGFCKTCGSQLFWLSHDGTRVSVSAGSLDAGGDLRFGRELFAEQRFAFDCALTDAERQSTS